jgi:hypothetical protein
LWSAQNQTRRPGDNICEYHAQLKTVLETFRTAGPRLHGVTLPIGPNRNMTIDVVCCILFVIQDMQEGDMLYGRDTDHILLTYNVIVKPAMLATMTLTTQLQPRCAYIYAQPMSYIAMNGNDVICKEW